MTPETAMSAALTPRQAKALDPAAAYLAAPNTYWTRVQIAKASPALRRSMLYSIADEERAKHDCDLAVFWSAMHGAEGCDDSLAELEKLVSL